MKIAYIVPGLDPTGPIIVVKGLINHLVKNGHEVKLYYLKDRDREMEFPCNVTKIHPNQKIDFDSFDIVHSHCFSADKYVHSHRKSINKAKVVTTFHQDTFYSLKYLYPYPISYVIARYMIYIQSKFDGVIAISKQVEEIHRPYVKNKIKIIYNGIDCTDTSYPQTGISYLEQIKNIKSQSNITLGTYANLVKRKGLSQIFKVIKENPDYHFIIIGDGPYKSHLENECSNLQIQKQVHFFPFIESPYKYFENVDIFCMPSYSEGFGLALLEAAYSYNAIVCSDLPSFHELFSNEVVFFKLDDINSLSNAIKKAYDNKKNYEIMAHTRATKFTKEIMAKNHLEYYQELLNSK